ncbi:DUF1702 family protein [Actinokineospora sp. NBRC 105648]|uniref:DUF1702 family protein n=1 Tax=Actinokineospora sp. NBRC 105648 TaxID=3032206 RepID=UPI0024A1CFEC|nr:DUF1702 family protein [Actinokineospora sp. NBRC 105648]GLZ42768.1 hypothetical protein Acsp05_63920 [Actinokineospora sp. NBRC 105648]
MTTLRPQLPMGMADFDRRGFRLDRPGPRAHLERHARSFLQGYNVAAARWARVHEGLAELPQEEQGFAHEGAAMYAGQRDVLTGGRAGAVTALLGGTGERYTHLIHVGMGWALSPLRLPLPVRLPDTPLLRWLALDGAGFADVFFGGGRALARRAERAGTDPRRLARLGGSGRAMWFLTAADPVQINEIIQHAPATARPALWSGVGLAAGYAGGVDATELDTLRGVAGRYAPHLAQGTVFAATARVRSGTVPAHTALACERLAETVPATATGWADEVARELGGRADVEAYLEWKDRVRLRVTASVTG